jgi:2-keto-myo-inositol isomerase
MKLSLNGATTMKADLATDVRAAAAAGFDYHEIWAAKLRKFLQQNPVADLQRLFDESGVRPLSINSIEHITFRDAASYEKIKAECEELSAIAAEIGCPYVVVVPGKLPSNGTTSAEIIDESVKVLRDLCAIAADTRVSIAFEFLGEVDCSVRTLKAANEIVTRAGCENLGLVIDSFHYYTGGSTLEMIEALDSSHLFIFHIDDAEDLARESLTDANRLLPGLGILPLKEIIAAFKRIGYDANASVEIFRPEYWERDPFELAREAKAAVESVLKV